MKRTTLLLTVGVSVLALLAVVVRKGGGMIVIPNRVRVVLVVSALALAAGLLTLASLAKPTQAQAETEKVNDWIPISYTIANPCTGEEVAIEGTAHVVGTITQDADGKFHVQAHTNFVGEGVGITSGAEYVVVDLTNFHGFVEDVEDPSESANFTQTATYHVIRRGSATPEDDFVFTLVYHLTINANGEVTTEVFMGSAECN